MSTETLTKECRWSCEHWAADPDDEYCAHPQAMKISPFGINLDRALGPNGRYPESMMEKDPAIGICGKERKLWVPRSPERMPSRK